MSLLETYAKNVRQTKGLHHNVMLQGLRHYVNTTPTEDLITQLNRITDIDLLRTLWEAGLKEPFRTEVLRRYEELQQRRRLEE